MAKTRNLLLVVVLALAAALAGALVARRMGSSPLELSGGTWLPQSRAVPAFELTDQDGAAFGMPRLAGAPSLLFFGFTHCPDVCPTTLALLAQLDADPPVPDLRTILVTVDPERDDVPAMKRYVSAFSSKMVGLTGNDEQIDRLLKSLGAARFRQPAAGGGYLVDHSATVYLLDRRANLVAVFTPPLELSSLRADLTAAAGRLER